MTATDSKDKNPTRWTKTRLRAALTESMSGYARQGFHYEVHIYRDMAHWRKSCGNLDSLCGDFLPWAEAKKVECSSPVVEGPGALP